VRFHRRDPATTPIEARLLARPWRSLRVPAVRRVGAGFLVLEFVEHGPVLGTAEHGAAVGRALAEVHSVRFDRAGHFDPGRDPVAVGEAFGDLVDALVEYARGCLAGAGAGLSPELRGATLRALEQCSPTLRRVAGPPVLLHADFKVSNLHWTLDDRLLVLDWEFAYAGSALSDVGQLLRWDPPAAFTASFATSYRAHGGSLVDGWETWAAAFDLVNLSGLVANLAEPGGGAPSARVRDVEARIERTLAALAT
jgi:aminoglycoside phosphotransferase (APT) family kinase protein